MFKGEQLSRYVEDECGWCGCKLTGYALSGDFYGFCLNTLEDNVKNAFVGYVCSNCDQLTCRQCKRKGIRSGWLSNKDECKECKLPTSRIIFDEDMTSDAIDTLKFNYAIITCSNILKTCIEIENEKPFVCPDIRDINQLPYSKGVIKDAIKLFMATPKGIEIQDSLVLIYADLSKYQKGYSEEFHNSRDIIEVICKYDPIVKDERERLEKEIEAYIENADHTMEDALEIIDARPEKDIIMQKGLKEALNAEDERIAMQLTSASKAYDEVKVKEIGVEIHSNGGLERMKQICYRSEQLGADLRWIEMMWHGIGEWLG